MFKKLTLMMFYLLASLMPCLSRAEAVNFTSYFKKSTGIYEGTVQSVETRRGTDNKTPYTFMTLEVKQSLKGHDAAGETIIIRQAGGGIWDEKKQEGAGLMIPGAPEIIEGDRLIVFLGKNNHDLVPFVGGEAGVLRISNDSQIGEFVTTYDGLRITAVHDDDGFELGPRWHDPEREQRLINAMQRSHMPLTSHSNKEVVVPLQESKPMTKSSFLENLKKNIDDHGPYPEIQYEEKAAGEIVIKAAH